MGLEPRPQARATPLPDRHVAPPVRAPTPRDYFDSDGDGGAQESTATSGADPEDANADPATPAGYEPEDGQQQEYAFGNWRANVRAVWRHAKTRATPVAVTSHLAVDWEGSTAAISTPAPDAYYRDRDWANDTGIACIPSGPDGLEQICRIAKHDPDGPDGPGGTPDAPANIFAVDVNGGAAMALQAALTAAGCHANIVLLTTVHTRGAGFLADLTQR